MPDHAITPLAISCVILGLSEPGSASARLLQWRWLLGLGKVSSSTGLTITSARTG